MNFQHKTVLITGGSRGIGAATAFAFAQRGARVAISYQSNTAGAAAVLAKLPGEGHIMLQANVGDPESVKNLVDQVVVEFDKLDIVVNNAGIFAPHPIDEVDYATWQKAWQDTLAVNLFGAANVCYCAAQYMIRQGGGKMVNVSSRGAFRGEPEFPAYGASKAALNAMSQSLAQKLGRHNIAVTVIAPGFVETDMAKEALEGEKGVAIRSQSSMGRVATPEEVAYGILFYASDGAEFMTGGIMDINGASYLRS